MMQNIIKNKKLMFIIGGVIAAIATLLIGMNMFGKETWTDDSYSTIKMGTTKEEVIKRFGKPAKIEDVDFGDPIPSSMAMWTNVNMKNAKAVKLYFKEGKLYQKDSGDITLISKAIDNWKKNMDIVVKTLTHNNSSDDYDDDDYDDDDYEDDDYDDESDDEYDEDDLVDDIGKAIDFFS